MKTDYKIILASGSPRRKELLTQIGFEFEIWPSQCEEEITKTEPSEVCTQLSRQKALDVASGIRSYNETHPDLAQDRDLVITTLLPVPEASPVAVAPEINSLLSSKKQCPAVEEFRFFSIT